MCQTRASNPSAAPAAQGIHCDNGGGFAPLLAPLLLRRPLAAASAAAGTAQICLALCHAPGMPCPLLSVVGIPCPGCGASRACAALILGRWPDWIEWHAFAPLFLLALVLFAIAAVLPRRPRDAFAAAVETIERRTGLARLLMFLLFLYWLGRLLYSPHDFAVRIRG